MTDTQTVHVAVYDTMSDWEVGHATAHINNPDWQRTPGRYRIATVAETAEPVTTAGGMRIVPELTVDQVRPDDSAMLILAGAATWLTGGNGPFARLAGEFLTAGTPVAAICGATGGLAAAGLLDDRRHTSNAREYLAAVGYGGGDNYVDEPAVTDGPLITASGTTPADFARAVLEKLDVYEPSVLASWYKLYGRNDPAGFYELMSVGA
jgi:putative intracellular protease/amidase